MNVGIRILLAEDNPSDLALAVHAFEKHNLANGVHVVRDGEEALQYLLKSGAYAGRAAATDPDVILLDLKLPKVDGLDVLRQIKADDSTRDIPVIVLTSSQAESDLTSTHAIGVDSYIVKPVDFGQFGEAVRLIGFYWLLLDRRPERSAAGPS